MIAGIGAGLGTGFAGMSAAAVITPMLVTFLDIPVYQAVGIALASDVLASAVSAYTYKENGNLDIRNGLIMMISVLVFYDRWKLFVKSCSKLDDERLFGGDDCLSWYQVYR